ISSPVNDFGARYTPHITSSTRARVLFVDVALAPLLVREAFCSLTEVFPLADDVFFGSSNHPYTGVLPFASSSAFGRENTLLTSSMQVFPLARMMPSAPGASAVAIAAIGSSGV